MISQKVINKFKQREEISPRKPSLGIGSRVYVDNFPMRIGSITGIVDKRWFKIRWENALYDTFEHMNQVHRA